MHRKFDDRTPKHACPTCKRPAVLTDREKSRGFQCLDCTRKDEAEF